MAGFPRVIGGYVAGGYVAGGHIYGAPPAPPAAPQLPPPGGEGGFHPGYGGHPGYGHPGYGPGFHPGGHMPPGFYHHPQYGMIGPDHPHHPHHHHHLAAQGLMPLPVMAPPAPESPPWRPMMAPGSPPLGEGHVPLPLTPETYSGMWGNTAGGGAPAGTTIIFSARPQKPFKANRLITRGTKSGATAIGNIIGQVFVGTDLQQGELGFFDLESIGAATAFDTWISFKQVEPGVWLRLQAQLTAYPTGTDFEVYTISVLGHYLH